MGDIRTKCHHKKCISLRRLHDPFQLVCMLHRQIRIRYYDGSNEIFDRSSFANLDWKRFQDSFLSKIKKSGFHVQHLVPHGCGT